jgi:RHS repeat-associated protein
MFSPCIHAFLYLFSASVFKVYHLHRLVNISHRASITALTTALITKRHFYLVLLFGASLPLASNAQTITPYGGYTPPGLSQGGAPGAFSLADFENMNLANGSLDFSLPILRIGGRGKAGYTMYINVGKRWALQREFCDPELPYCPQTFLHYPNETHFKLHKGFSPGVLEARSAYKAFRPGQCTVNDRMVTRLYFTEPDGTERQFVDTIYNGEPKGLAGGGGCQGNSRGTIWVATDGSSATFISNTPIVDYTTQDSVTYFVSGKLKWKDGTVYTIDNSIVTRITDSNGNSITFQYDLGGKVTTITDSLNQVTTIAYNTTTSPTHSPTISYKGAGGATRTITVSYDSQWLRPDYSGPLTYGTAFPDMYEPHVHRIGTPIKQGGPTHITMPDGRSYRLWYNPYGELARVDIPTGGRVEYDWGGGGGASPTGMVAGNYPSEAIYRRVKERRVYIDADDSIPSEQAIYDRPSENGPVSVDHVAPTDPSRILSRTHHYFYGSPIVRLEIWGNNPVGYYGWAYNIEYKTEYFAAGGATLLRRIERNFQPRVTYSWASFEPQLHSEVTTLADVSPNLVTQRTYSYDPYNNVTDVYEYTYGSGGPGPLLRRTQTFYLANNPWQGNSNYATDLNIHIRNLPTQISVFDGNNTELSRTSFYYDVYSQVPIQDCPNIVQHDGGFDTGYGPRGNLVKTTKVVNFNPATSIDNYFQYDIAGNVVMTKDGRTPAGITTFDFSDRYGTTSGDAQSNTPPTELSPAGQVKISYAYPTKVTNALGHETYTKYDYYLGKPVDSEDENEVVTSFAYNDALDRLTQVVRGASSSTVKNQTSFDYNDAERTITTTSDKDTFDDKKLKSAVVHDGLGRTIESRQYESASSYISVNTFYDALGRASQVSNPYRPGEPVSWTTTEYDALSRVTRVTTPDGASVVTAYNGARALVTDQAGRQRISDANALGQLINVWEVTSSDSATESISFPGYPGITAGYRTKYVYDALNNLNTVTQQIGTSGNTQTRTFTYDSLKRLISATNPESGTVTYSYDANSNLEMKTDARNITTTYTYDALNRPVTKTYAGSVSTPQVKYFYDQQALPTGAPSYTRGFATGRLVAATYGGGSEGDYYGYDELGRVKIKYQRINTTNYQIQATYNRAGIITSETYPSGHVVNYSHDQAGRLTNFTGNLGGGAAVNYATSIQYNGYGLKSRETYGTQTPLYLNIHYNNRLQLADLRLGDNSNDEWNWSRGALTFFHGGNAITQGNPVYPSFNNNGNLLRQIHSVQLTEGGQVSHVHDYSYDPLNRVTSVIEHQQSQNEPLISVFKQAFSYDKLGNRKIEQAGTGTISDELIWVEDSLPAGAAPASDGGDSWMWMNSGFNPYSGAAYHQSALSAGGHQHYFYGVTEPLQINAGDRLYAYIYLDPASPPSEIMLQWHENGSWEHRAYWGENIFPFGTNGTASRWPMGALPSAGQWVRLEVPASAVGLEGKTINGMAFTLYGGKANWDQAGKANTTSNTIWVEDSLPAGAIIVAEGGDNWAWLGPSPIPYSGSAYHQSNLEAGPRQHYFSGATQTLQVNAGDQLYAYVYLDPANPPSEVMLQWAASGETGHPHRAYWGENLIQVGTNGTQSRQYVGPLPLAGLWVRLEVPASAVGLEGKTVNGMAFTLYGGRASWDKAGKVRWVNNGAINGRLLAFNTANNRLTSVNGMAMTYDAAGNQTNDGSGLRKYDGENRMVEAYNGAVLVSQYIYGADGKRVKRIIGGQETWQVYGIGGELLAEYAAGGASSAAQKEYGYRNGQMLVVWDSSETEDRRLQWMVQDHLGSTRMVVDRSGSLGGIRRRDFLPFGEELQAGIGIRSASLGYGGDSIRQKFTGKERDDETGNDFFEARYYSPIQGRFTTVDPYDPLNSGEDNASRDYYILQPQNWNRYAYALNNPNKYVDPDGKNPLLTALAGAIGGAAVGAGIEIAKAIYRGESLRDANVLQRIGAKALSGAIIGGVTGLTGNLTAGEAAAALATASIAGGITERAVDGNDQTNAFSISNIGIDTVAGGAGGYIGQAARPYAEDLTYAMRQATYNAYASVAGRVSIFAEKLYLQGALNTFKLTYNVGFEQKIQGAARGATRSAITFAGQFGLRQLDLLRIQTESEMRRESERKQSCNDKESGCPKLSY